MKRLQLAVSQSSSSLDPFLHTLAGQSLKAWFTSSDNKLLLNQLRQAGLKCCQEDPAAADIIPGVSEDRRAAAAAEAQQSAVSSAVKEAAAAPGSAAARPLEGVAVCVTGAFASGMSRDAVERFVKEMGGSFKRSVTRETHWLVVSTSTCNHIWCRLLAIVHTDVDFIAGLSIDRARHRCNVTCIVKLACFAWCASYAAARPDCDPKGSPAPPHIHPSLQWPA